jgi:hypothetical protein
MGGTAWPHERHQARRFVDHASMCVSQDRLILHTRTSSNQRAVNGAATNETARVRCPGQARKVGDPGLFQPHETDGSNPSWLWRRAAGSVGRSRPLRGKGLSAVEPTSFDQADGIGRSALTFRRLLLSRWPSTLTRLDDWRCDGDLCYPTLSLALPPGFPGRASRYPRRIGKTSGSG